MTGERSNAVRLAGDDWKATQETVYLLCVPEMRESIKKGLETPPEEGSGEIVIAMLILRIFKFLTFSHLKKMILFCKFHYSL